MKKISNQNNGITLIALVITIIVLLILAGVSISMLAGNNGILTNARKAKIATEEAQIEEMLKLEILGAMINSNQKLNIKELKANLNNKGITAEECGPTVIVYLNGKTYSIDDEGLQKELVPGLYYAGTDDLIMTWEELIDTDNTNMLQLTNGSLQRKAFDLSSVQDKNGNTVGNRMVKLIIDPSVTNIEYMPGLYQVAEIILPNTITNINNSAFASCSGLERITIPSGNIGYGILNDCTSLKELVIGDSVTSLQYPILGNVFDLEKLVIGEGITEIPNNFLASQCGKLKELRLGKNIERIGDYAFCNAVDNLKELTLPENLKTIGERAFAEFREMESISLPEGIESIGVQAFEEWYKLKKIVLPSSLRQLGRLAFIDCSALEEVIILNGLTTLNENVFSGCAKLRKIVIPTSITKIEYQSSFSYLTDIYYTGTEEQWQSIDINSLLQGNIGNVNMHYNYEMP